jgi:iron complex transport system substrate-binding protein
MSAGREIDEITGQIVDAAVKLNMRLGPGLLESVYQVVLARELERRGLMVERQKPISFGFDGLRFDDAFRIDPLVEGRVVVELKSVEALLPVHFKQLLIYLRLLNLPVGQLINFGAATMTERLKRVVNNYDPSLSAPPRLRVNKNALANVQGHENERKLEIEVSRGNADAEENANRRPYR